MASPIEVKMLVTKASELSMQKAINYSAVALRRGLRGTLRKTSIFYVQAAAKRTPQSKKNRKLRKISEKKERILFSHGVRYRVQKFNSKTNKFHWVFAKSEEEKAEKALIKHRGLYKKIWFELLAPLGKPSNKSFHGQKTASFAKRSVRTKDLSFLKEDPYIKLTVRRPEMEKMAPGVVHRALASAKNRLVGEMKNKLNKKLEAAWKKK